MTQAATWCKQTYLNRTRLKPQKANLEKKICAELLGFSQITIA